MKVYGSDICIDCRNYKEEQKKRGIKAEFIDITENTENLKEFLRIRDNDEIFAPVKKNGSIGIPFFVSEDGKKTFDMEEAFSWTDEENSEKEGRQSTAYMKIGMEFCGGCRDEYFKGRAMRLLREKHPEHTYIRNDRTALCDIWIVCCGCKTACADGRDLKYTDRKFVAVCEADFDKIAEYLGK